MDEARLMDSSASFQSSQNPSISMNPLYTSSNLTNQLVMTSGILVIWTMLIVFGLFVTILSIFLVYKSRQRKSASLNPLEGIGTSKSANYQNGQESGYSGELTPPNSSSVNIGNLVPTTRRIKVSSSYASLTSDSSSEEEFPEGRRKSQISMTHELTIGPKGTVRAFPVQPLARETPGRGPGQRSSLSLHQNCKPPGNSVMTNSTINNTNTSHHSINTSANDSGTEKKPQLTISMSVDSESHLVKVTLVKCEHLKRSIEPKESTFRRVVRARGLSSGFLPLGVLARVYRLSDIRESFLLSRQHSTCSSNSIASSGIVGKGSRSTSIESDSGPLPAPAVATAMANNVNPAQKSVTPLMETSLIKSRKGSYVKFNESTDSIEVSVEDFPLRVSLYEMDKNKVKSPLGHSIIDYLTSLNVATLNQIVLNVRLYETVFEAMRSANQEQNKG